MRCPECGTSNPEGVAYCENCGQPFTAYAGQVSGEVSAAVRARAARLAQRPASVPLMAAADVVVALAGPAAGLAGRVAARPRLNADATNYVAPAFGAVGIAFAAAVLVPLALALVVTAWGAWAQRTWAWTVNAVVLGGTALAAITGYWPSGGFGRLVALAGTAVLASLWFQRNTRDWYGVD